MAMTDILQYLIIGTIFLQVGASCLETGMTKISEIHPILNYTIYTIFLKRIHVYYKVIISIMKRKFHHMLV